MDAEYPEADDREKSSPEAEEVANLLVLGLGRDILDIDSGGRHFDFACDRYKGGNGSRIVEVVKVEVVRGSNIIGARER